MAKRSKVQIFDVNSVDVFMSTLHKELKFPHVYMYASKLGGPENVSILLTITMDPKSTWANNILENSRYAKIHIDKFGVTEKFNGYKLKLRKFTGKSASHIAEKINAIKINV